MRIRFKQDSKFCYFFKKGDVYKVVKKNKLFYLIDYEKCICCVPNFECTELTFKENLQYLIEKILRRRL